MKPSLLTPEQVDERLSEAVDRAMALVEDLAVAFREGGHPALVPAAALFARGADLLHSHLVSDRLERDELSDLSASLRTLAQAEEEVTRG